jgi:EAL domain-containing protein (putative c-di-GMP-specific phosphodiesterase class I)
MALAVPLHHRGREQDFNAPTAATPRQRDYMLPKCPIRWYEDQDCRRQVADSVRGSMMQVGRSPGTSVDSEFDALISHEQIQVVYQPIVALSTGRTVGYEALARGPAGGAFATPELLLRHAARVGRIAEIDWACRAAAFRGALAAGLPHRMLLFSNVEPSSLRTPPPAHVTDLLDAAVAQLQIVAEITERSLASDPASLLTGLMRVRERSIRIALDDIGADDTNLAMMPLLSPDVIKLDRSIIQGRVTPSVSAVVNAVLAEAERTGAVVLAEGIESPRHLAIARSVGATLGQGWLFGRPGPLPRTFPSAGIVLPQVKAPAATAATPFEVVRQQRPVTHATKEMLKGLSSLLENKCLQLAEPAALLATFQYVRYFDDLARRRYRDLATRCVFTAAYAHGMPAEPVAGIRGGPLSSDDPLTNEWTIIVLGTHFAGGLFACDRGSPGGENDRMFDRVITYDRELVIEAAQPLLHRLLPAEPDTIW